MHNNYHTVAKLEEISKETFAVKGQSAIPKCEMTILGEIIPFLIYKSV